MNLRIMFVLLYLVSIAPASAQDTGENNLGNWIGFTSSQRISDKWSTFVQGELRTWEMVSNLNEILFRVAGLYDFNHNTLGLLDTCG